MPTVKSGVIHIKTTIEPRSQLERIEHQRSNEGRSPITAIVEDLRQVRKILVQRVPHVIDVIELRIGPREDRCMRGRGQRHLSVSPRKNGGMSSQCVKVGSESAL